MFDKLSISNLVDWGIPLQRFSEDTGTVNYYGYRLIEMCKTVGLCIANGRCFEDLYIGRNTCHGKSLINYVLVSPEIFTHMTGFQVNEFDPIFSDVHSVIDICLYANSVTSVVPNVVTDHVENMEHVVKKNRFGITLLMINFQKVLMMLSCQSDKHNWKTFMLRKSTLKYLLMM